MKLSIKVIESIHLVYWMFTILDALGVDLVLKEGGQYLSFDDVDFEEQPKEPSAMELGLVASTTNFIIGKYLSIGDFTEGRRQILKDYFKLRRSMPRGQKEA